MGIRAAVAVLATSFLLGTMLTHWMADALTLWKVPLTDAHLFTAASYYTLLSTMPSIMIWVLVAVVLSGAIALFMCFSDRRAGNVMFDGASIFLYLSALAAYLYSAVPRLQQFAVLPPFARNLPNFPPHRKDPTVELASSHLVVSVALTGVMILQAARYWAEGEDAEAAANNTASITDSAESESSHGWKRSPRPSGLEAKTESSPGRTGSLRKKATTAKRKPASKNNGVL